MTYIKPLWSAPKNVRAYTTTRNGGFSHAPYASFNLAAHVGDTEAAVVKNRRKLRNDLALPNEPHWLNQQHSINVVEIVSTSNSTVTKIPADAAFTYAPQQICVVLTADCLPILLCNKKGTLVAAIHAGWRGLAHGIVATALQKIAQKTGETNSELLAWLAPAISEHAFEVGEEVYQAFAEKDELGKRALQRIATHKWHANIYLLAKLHLIRCGIKTENIFSSEFCTFHNNELFFSYRRDRATTGRMASLIWLER